MLTAEPTMAITVKEIGSVVASRCLTQQTVTVRFVILIALTMLVR